MVSKVKVDAIESTTGSGTIALNNQLSGMTVASLPSSGTLPALDGSALTNMPAGGKVLQVVYAETTNSGGYALTTTASTYQDIPGVSVAITPASTSNYLLIMVTANFDAGGGGADVGMGMELYRVSTAIRSTTEYITENQVLGNAHIIMREQVVSTSSQTFFAAAKTNGGGTLYIGSSNEKATITIMEIAG
jgi:hypothetical protein